ncbi:hypothetical protein H6F53_13300 [Trichocoleus sp. FACHB-832]|uniref:hypothetical protein n=1 Tax=Trichocoleus sp. FACHB-832 TaxID=2692875 RepID=UPI0016870C54|nr:hypothetical protein [Trichocoleus sp. FACHB-832]MBD1906454.1 hypothetical protein [Trichocoleus sp. FACHB-832]
MVATLHFEHWSYKFTEDNLRYCSPNKSIKETKFKLCSAVTGATKVFETKSPIQINENFLLCANEAFPEAALADPLADIKIWDEWRSGARVFPYPGEYARLSINQQLGKKNSTSSIGVIGEIIAGILGQVLISPDVLVRVIGAWPDFIFSPTKNQNRYPFLEAKAFTPQAKSLLDSFFDIPRDEWGECLINAARQLTIDPFVKMWYSFTEIQEIRPTLRLSTKFFELDVPDERRDNHVFSAPDALVNGLAERAIQTGIFHLLKSRTFDFTLFINKNSSKQRKKAEQELINVSKEGIESVLNTIKYLDLVKVDRGKLQEGIIEQIKNLKLSESEADKEYLTSITSQDLIGEIDFVRRIGTQSIYKINIPYNKRGDIVKNWKPNFFEINLPYKHLDECDLWRCGGFLFFLCDGKKETIGKISQQILERVF